MTELYKITDEKDQTRNECQWGENITVETHGEGGMCSSGFTHWYTDPRFAVLFNPIHGSYNLSTAHLWEGEGEIIKSDGLKVGCKRGTTIRRIEFPQITLEQKIKFAIKCALTVYKEESFVIWANNWLSGKDRSARSAEAAESAAESAAWSAAESVAESAAWSAAWSAAMSARSAAMSARSAAMSVRSAAMSVRSAARSARSAEKEINFIEIIDEILKGE